MSAVTITAQSMIYAQGATLDPEARAILKAKADRHRARDNETCLQHMSVPVRDSDGTLIGHMTYAL